MRLNPGISGLENFRDPGILESRDPGIAIPNPNICHFTGAHYTYRRPMQSGRPIQTGQLRHKKTYMPKLVPYILPSSAAALTAVSIELY